MHTPETTAGSRALCRVEVSTPGKLILMGEHAAVYDRPALVAAIGLRMRVQFEVAPGAAIQLDLPQLRSQTAIEWPALLEYTDRTAKRWEHYAKNPTPRSFRSVRGADPDHIVKIALGESARFLEETSGPAFRLRIDSELPMGSGFGSSAAVAVGVTLGYLRFRGVTVSRSDVWRITHEVERRQHGTPSGVDNSCVLWGGVLWASRDAEGNLERRTIAPRSPLLQKLKVMQSGSPRESSGIVVAAVRERLKQAGPRLVRVLDRLAHLTNELAEILDSTAEQPAETTRLLREGERCLEALGVVPEPTIRLIRQIEARGGAAKISGAGALRGPGAGSLLVYLPHDDDPTTWDFLRALPCFRVPLGGAGAREEAAA